MIEDFVAGDSIGIYAYNIPKDGSISIDDCEPNFMFNQAVVKQSNSSWEYSPIKYWPNSEDYDMFFFGYAPHSENEEYTMYDSSKDGFPIIAHQTPATLIDSRDLIMAGRRCETEVDHVQLDFVHMLTRLRFEFRNGIVENENTPYTMVVKSIKLINVTTLAAFTYVEDEESDNGLLIVNYKENEVWGSGTVTASVATGCLIGGVDFNGDGVPDLFGVDDTVMDEDGYPDSDGKPDIRYDEDGETIIFGEYDILSDNAEVVLNDTNIFGGEDGTSAYHIDDPSTIYTIAPISETEDCFIEPTEDSSADNYYTDITTADHYMFIDPYILKDDDGNENNVMLSVEIELYVEGIVAGYAQKTRVGTYTEEYHMNDIINNKMERGGSYVLQLSYQPIPGSGLFVNVIDYWENIYIEHEI